jgi:hypothetical protein
MVGELLLLQEVLLVLLLRDRTAGRGKRRAAVKTVRHWRK